MALTQTSQSGSYLEINVSAVVSASSAVCLDPEEAEETHTYSFCVYEPDLGLHSRLRATSSINVCLKHAWGLARSSKFAPKIVCRLQSMNYGCWYRELRCASCIETTKRISHFVSKVINCPKLVKIVLSYTQYILRYWSNMLDTNIRTIVIAWYRDRRSRIISMCCKSKHLCWDFDGRSKDKLTWFFRRSWKKTEETAATSRFRRTKEVIRM